MFLVLAALCSVFWTSAGVSGDETQIEKRLLFPLDYCFSDLGCFTNKWPFGGTNERPIGFLPEKPEKINTRFFLYTRDNPDVAHALKHTDVAANTVGPFDANRGTKFIIHGFIQTSNATWMHSMKDALLRKADLNVFLVDWSGGNNNLYTQATANSQVVGAEIARLVKTLNLHAGLRLSDVHLIGHSLGAHAAGYAGKRVSTIGRITGMDPAEPYFQWTPVVVRLDSSDADFVDVIHTDGATLQDLGAGMIQAIGHVDFYPNGGMNQPGCPATVGKIFSLFENNPAAVEAAVTCSHSRAIDYFIESIESSCGFKAYSCGNYNEFLNGKCLEWKEGEYPRMGYHADEARAVNGSVYLLTSSSSPFCRHHFYVKVHTAPTTYNKGTLSVSFNGTLDASEYVTVVNDKEMYGNISYSQLVTSAASTGGLQSVSVHFSKTKNFFISWKYSNFVDVESVTVSAGDASEHQLCSSEQKIISETNRVFTVC